MLLVKFNQALNNWIKKFSFFCFCKFLFLKDLRNCFCLKRARLWLEFRIKFNPYSIRSFQRALVGFNNLWIHFIFRKINLVSISKISAAPLQTEGWCRCMGGRVFFHSRGNIYFLISFLIYFEIVCIWLLHHRFDKRVWFTIIFLPFKESHTSRNLSQLELSRIELPKLTPSVLMEKCGHSIYPGWSILFLYTPVHKACLFEKVDLRARCIFI